MQDRTNKTKRFVYFYFRKIGKFTATRGRNAQWVLVIWPLFIDDRANWTDLHTAVNEEGLPLAPQPVGTPIVLS